MAYEKSPEGLLRELVPVDVSIEELEARKVSLESTIIARQELVNISKAELAEVEVKIAECQKLGVVKLEEAAVNAAEIK